MAALCGPPPFAALHIQSSYLWDLASEYGRLRRYREAERCMRQVAARGYNTPIAYCNLSVYLGKQGKYEEACKAARISLECKPRDNMHAQFLLAEWQQRLGNTKEARQILSEVTPPRDSYELSIYYGSLACVHAAFRDEEKVREYLELALGFDLFGGVRPHARRDIVFDRYRDKEWFIRLVGETLAK